MTSKLFIGSPKHLQCYGPYCSHPLPLPLPPHALSVFPTSSYLISTPTPTPFLKNYLWPLQGCKSLCQTLIHVTYRNAHFPCDTVYFIETQTKKNLTLRSSMVIPSNFCLILGSVSRTCITCSKYFSYSRPVCYKK